MSVRIRARGLDGLARRLAATGLPAAATAAADAAATELQDALAQATGAPVAVAGTAERPVLRIADPVTVARLAGGHDVEADPAVARARLGLRRRRT